jgi:hypothetical protein
MTKLRFTDTKWLAQAPEVVNYEIILLWFLGFLFEKIMYINELYISILF